MRGGGWTAVRRPILVASASTAVAAAALVARALGHSVGAASFFIAFSLFSLFGWTHAAAVSARRLPAFRAHSFLALVVSATTVVMTVAAAVWFASVTVHAPSFVGAAQLAVVATFMVAGTALAAVSEVMLLRA